MNFQEAKERAQQEKADALEEARVEREDKQWLAESEERRALHYFGLVTDDALYPPMPPYIFASERSQRRAEEEAAFYEPIDDYAAWQDQAVGAEQLFR